MTTRYQNVVIVGGSISGLMAALTLTSAGCKVIILERIQESAFKTQGAGLGIRPDVNEFLENFRSKSVSIDRFEGRPTIVLNLDGTIAGEAVWPPGLYTTSWTSLATVLRRSLPHDIQFASDVKDIIEIGDKLSVLYQHNGVDRRVDEVDLVIGADGANSTVRSIMGFKAPRIYAGYCFYRGIVSINDLSPEAAKLYASNKNFWSVYDHSNFMAYRISEDKIMWGVYRFHTEQELNDALLDSSGHQHSFSLTNGMRPEIITAVKEWSKEHFPQQLHECVEMSTVVTLQSISDCISPGNTAMGGKVLLVGEASLLPRPHIAAGTGHAAYHALRLKDLAEGTINVEEWSRNTKAYSNVLKDYSLKQEEIWMRSEGNYEVVMASRLEMVEMVKQLAVVKSDLRVSR